MYYDIFVTVFTDFPRVLAMLVRIYLARGMTGKIDCPVDANPPVTQIIWSKNERMIDMTRMTRMRTNKEGTLIIKSVITSDEGRYACTPYSPLGAGQISMPIQVLVRGETHLGTSKYLNVLNFQMIALHIY